MIHLRLNILNFNNKLSQFVLIQIPFLKFYLNYFLNKDLYYNILTNFRRFYFCKFSSLN